MQLTLDIPDDVAGELQAALGNDLGRVALERLALEGYKAGKLSTLRVQKLLGYEDRLATEEWLGRMGAHVNYSLDDLDADRDTFDRLSAR